MSVTKIIDELEVAHKRIAVLEHAIRGALSCRDLWGNPSDLSHVEECHMGEVQMLQAMEDEFKRLMAHPVIHGENCNDLYTACKECSEGFKEWVKTK